MSDHLDPFGSAWPNGCCTSYAKAGEPEPHSLTCGFPLRADGTCPNADNHTTEAPDA